MSMATTYGRVFEVAILYLILPDDSLRGIHVISVPCFTELLLCYCRNTCGLNALRYGKEMKLKEILSSWMLIETNQVVGVVVKTSEGFLEGP
jgi:hypothetical protein